MATILIADDDRTFAKSLEAGFSYDGHDVHVAYDGQKAIDEYKRLQPDLLITDFDMPYKNGLSVAKEVSDYDPCAKIIIHSGAMDISEEHALTVGALALVRKKGADGLNKLEEKVKELLNK